MDMEIFFEIHRNLPREGPGSVQSTEKAFSLLADIPEDPSILDIGCGPGMQTITLVKSSGGTVTAVDNHQPFLDALVENARTKNLSDRIRPVNASMFDLDLPPESFDVIWAEGSIYIIGFETGLKSWRQFLKPGGYVAVTEASWLREDPPEEVSEFWHSAYPAMNPIAENLEIVKECGYRTISHFTLPESDWWDNYYLPMKARLESLREKYAGNSEALAVIEEERLEIEMYRKYSQWYGYVFYIMQGK